MKAIAIRQHGDLDELTFDPDFPNPQPDAGEVVIQVRSCALNYHDLFTLKGMPGIKITFPRIMGIDLAGDIAALGRDVDGWSVGERVMIDPIDRQKGLLIGEMRDGGLAEYVAVPAHTLVRLPDGMSYDDGASLPTAYGTAYRMMVTRGRIKPGETVLILGASGGVGTCCVQLAKLAGAEVIATASSEVKLERLRELGADRLINYAEQDFTKEIHALYGKPRIWGEGGVDVIVNFTGGDTWVPSLKALTKGGRMLTCGATAGFDPRTDIRYIWTFEHNIMGSNGWSREDVAMLIEMVGQGRLRPVIDSTLPLAETRTAFQMLRDRQCFGKLIVRSNE
ncbi:MAG: zinc-binding dehydrogenase [Alphaproteobacteria bacterium]|nr:zinc-binding dehydrogenase [Alphaproteobacteria bacterium]